MSTVIDSLIVTLGLDSKDVDAKAPGVRQKLADLEKSATKTEHGVKGIGKASKDTAGELTVLSAKLGSFLAVLGGTVAVRAFVKDTIETNTQLYFLSRNLEMNTQKLFAWGVAAQELGGGKGSLQNFFRSIAAIPGQLLTGQTPPLLTLFARLGINFNDDPNKIMMEFAKRFEGVDRKKAWSFLSASGLDDTTINEILLGPSAMKAQQARDKLFAPPKALTDISPKLKTQLVDIGAQFVKVGYDLLTMALPALEKFLSILESIGAWSEGHEKIVAVIAGVVTALTGIVALGSAVGYITIGLGALLPILTAVGSALPTVAVAGIVAALAAGIVLLAQDYKVWSEGGTSLFDWTEFEKNVRKAGEAFGWLGDKIEKATDAFKKWLVAHGVKVPDNAAGEAGAWYWNHMTLPGLLGIKIKPRKPDEVDSILDQIFTREGFYDSSSSGKQTIPQKAHNPGDIEYGDFAISHGATGYVLAQGGKKIASFPDDATGKAAARALLGTKGYAGLSRQQAISRWQTGSALANGVSNASSVSSSVSSGPSSSSVSTDNSKVTHIGTINLSNPSGSAAMTPSMVRGMDWNTLLTQQNFGLY
jgi:hypothetical protein